LCVSCPFASRCANENDRDYYEKKAAGLDRQIDELTYDLYGLKPEEHALVAGS